MAPEERRWEELGHNLINKGGLGCAMQTNGPQTLRVLTSGVSEPDHTDKGDF